MAAPDHQGEARQKTVLFFPLNSPGHINSSLGIADRLRTEYKHRTVFLLLGEMIGDSIRKHGHELVTLEEANPFEDYEILEGEDATKPVDEDEMRRAGRQKRKFPGVYKWPQLLMRQAHNVRLPPVESFVKSCPLMEGLMVGELIDNQESYAAAIESIKPDLIVIDAYYIPPCLVNQSRIPWVRLYSANPMMLIESALEHGTRPPAMIGEPLYNMQERERLRQEEPHRWRQILDGWRATNDRMFAAMRDAGGLLERYLLEQGCEPLPPGKQAPDSPHLNLYMFPRELDYIHESDLFRGYPPRWLACDSLMRRQETPTESTELRDWAQKLGSLLINKEAVVYFSLGSLASGMWQEMQRYVEMLAHDKRRLYVVSKGVNGHRYELSPDNMLGDNYIPQNYFLQRSDLAIIHGGNNSITECLFHGLPMIVLPVFADQLDNAQRIEDLGLGRRLNVYDCTREQLLEAIDGILKDEAVLGRARRVGQLMQQRDDLSTVTRLLDQLIIDGELEEDQIQMIARQTN